MSTAQTNLYHLTIREAGELIRTQQLSPVELVRAFLDRIEAIEGQLHSYITVLNESAMAEARTAEAEILGGNYRGPLHGIPIALKDLYDTAGIRTTSGSRVDMERVPSEDATVVARFKSAGAILLGKLSMYEYALGGPDPTTSFPLARNPWNLDHIPGGSSSGSGSAVASGQCMGALGSCTGGSIRGPASLLWNSGTQGDLWASQPPRSGDPELDPGPLRSHDLDRGGHRADAPGHRRARPQRPHHQLISGARLLPIPP